MAHRTDRDTGSSLGPLAVALSIVSLLVFAAPASAELVFFSSGRTLSVKSHRAEGESLVLALRTGGEIVCDASVVTRIAPDEVPYPEPEPPGSAMAAAAGRSESASVVPYAEIIDRLAAEQGVDAKLVRAVIQVESAYRRNARSPKGAVGLMQLMPATGRQYTAKSLYDPESNIEAGIKHLKGLLERFPLALALAAYNAGEGAVQRFRGVPPYPETRDYVSRILKLAAL
jgi:soluble lytic murein transglycosylase-like protein